MINNSQRYLQKNNVKYIHNNKFSTFVLIVNVNVSAHNVLSMVNIKIVMLKQ